MRHKVSGQERTLAINTVFLYIMQFSTVLLSLATVPYLTRVFGATVYGKVGLAISYMTYVQIILDFGFILSATQKVAEHRNDREYLSALMTSVTVVKLVLGLPIGVCFSLYALCTPALKSDFLFYALYLLGYGFQALMPDFFYRGMENMKIFTVRTLAIKVLFTAMTFMFIKSAEQLLLVPTFMLFGNLTAFIIIYIDIVKKYQISFSRITLSSIKSLIKFTLPFFASRISSTVYQAANTIILSYVYGISPIIGYYTSGDKLISVAKMGSAPIADSLYPYMVKNKNYKMVKKILIVLMPLVTVAVGILWIFADTICVFLFGPDFAGTGKILRCLLPIALVILPTYVICFPVLVPMGLSKYANLSNVVGLCVQVVQLVVLALSGHFDVYSLCIASSITEVSIFLYRFGVVIKYRKRLNS